MAFELHPQLAADTFPIVELPLSSARLMNNRLFPWIILVPRVPGARDMADLSTAEQHQLADEIHLASTALRRLCSPYKLNVGALGNKVEMLHVHVIARFKEDSAWPDPVWGKASEPYKNADEFIANIKKALSS